MSELELVKYVTSFLYGIHPSKVTSKQRPTQIESYYKNNQGEIIDSKFKVENDVVVWGIRKGRWRTHKKDSVITFKVVGDVLRLTETFYGSQRPNFREFNIKQ